jgi:hypothetical protein
MLGPCLGCMQDPIQSSVVDGDGIQLGTTTIFFPSPAILPLGVHNIVIVHIVKVQEHQLPLH